MKRWDLMKFLKLVFGLILIWTRWSANAESTTYLAMYLQGSKIGYSSYESRPDHMVGKPVTRGESHTRMDMTLLGSAVTLQADSTIWTNPSGTPIRIDFVMESGGRKQSIRADFNTKSVLIALDNNGTRSTRKLPLPPGPVVDDALTPMVNSGKANEVRQYFVLDPTTVTFEKNVVKSIGKATADVRGRKIEANLYEVTDPHGTTKVFFGAKGEIIKVESLLGMELLPVGKSIALSRPGGYSPTVDLAVSSSLTTDRPIENPSTLSRLKLKIEGHDCSATPSDETQTVVKQGDAWVVDVHPVALEMVGASTIQKSAYEHPEWVAASLDMPSDQPRFKTLAKQIIGSETDPKKASLLIKAWVFRTMRPNAGIGVIRDATEVLSTKEGVCRDYAILTTTLLRAAGIPARLASGIVNWEGTFYYHAWSEAWADGHWIGIDSTTADVQLAANHLKLGDGNVESAYSLSFLEKAKLSVLEVAHGITHG